MDYIIEQASRYDGRNLKQEKQVRNTIVNIYHTMRDRALSCIAIYDTINSPLQFQMLVNKLSQIISDGYGAIYRVLSRELIEHVKDGYNDMDDLIDIGMETSSRLGKSKISEIKHIVDNNTVEYINQHAFEYVKKLSNETMDQMRIELTKMALTDQYNKKEFAEMVGHMMDTSTSRADMIAQTEMSRAYNAGMIDRMNEFNEYGEHIMRKYWYGFKYSEITCEYCKPRIGMILDINDHREELPAHPRCRCVWLPYMDGWDGPIPSEVTRRADMLKRVYSPDDVYRKIKLRLNIDYAEHIPIDYARSYVAGDRSDDVLSAIKHAREQAILDKIDSFDIPATVHGNNMDREYKAQMKFWKEYVAEHIVDNDKEELKKCYIAVKGVMSLTWSGEQLHYFARLLDIIDENI